MTVAENQRGLHANGVGDAAVDGGARSFPHARDSAGRLTTQDALVLAWIVEREGMGAAMIAARVGRKRQSVQRTLVRLEDRFLVQRFESDSRDRTEGWGLTDHGRETWGLLQEAFGHQDAELARRGVNFRGWLLALEDLMKELMAVRRNPFSPGLVDPPVDDMPQGRDH